MEKESSTEFCGVLIMFHEVMKLDRVFNLTYVVSFPQMQLTSFFYLGFLSRPFPNHRASSAGEEEGYFFNFLPHHFQPLHRHFRC